MNNGVLAILGEGSEFAVMLNLIKITLFVTMIIVNAELQFGKMLSIFMFFFIF